MSSTKKKTLKVRLFTVIYMIRDDDSDASGALVGPKVYARIDDAVDAVFDAVSGRILTEYSDEFVSVWSSESPAFSIDPENYKVAEIVKFFTAADSGEKRSILNWFFGMLNGEGYEAILAIDEHDLCPAHVMSHHVA